MKAEFICSASDYNNLPSMQGDEFCLLGRSNVGKSSFINHVFGDGTLARVSGTPGKTILANYYKTSDGSFWVDLPGYGFAVGSKSEHRRWSMFTEEYCLRRISLKGGLWLLDVRHPGLETDRKAFEWFAQHGISLMAVITKCDKMSRSQLNERKKDFVKEFGLSEEPVLYSVNSDICRSVFWDRFNAWRSSLHFKK
jgi:GTP-binding protein